MKLVNVLTEIIKKRCTKNKTNNEKNGKNNTKKAKQIINQKTIIDGLYESLLKHMLCGKLTRQRLKTFIASYTVYITTNEGKHYPRICITPHTKWFTKQHVVSHRKETNIH